MTIDRKDFGAGAVFIAVALLYGGIAWRSLPIGQTLSMGPGYFPLVLCGLLILVGAILIGRSLMSGKATLFFDRIAWRPVILVSVAILFFGAFLRQTGLLLAVFLTSFVCALADDEAKPAKAVIVSACLAVLCTLLFIYAVRLPLPVFGAWFVAG